MILEQFVVPWLTVTFHQHNLSSDMCAILSTNKVDEWRGQAWKTHLMLTWHAEFWPSNTLHLCDMVVKD